MKYNPHEITVEELSYTIPLYQRLFEWDTDNIIMLLDDLKKEYEQTNGKGDYYIGMLTSTDENELVDGQQRFVVMMLLGCVLQKYYEGWNDFLFNENNEPRLDFLSRPIDNAYLKALIKREGDGPVVNYKMQNGYLQIKKYMAENVAEEKKKSFAEYIYHHLTFFISYLPEAYSPRELNTYFERMNTTGKNLEQHEILKVKLLSNLDGNIDRYMLLWNKLADVDTLLIRRRNDRNFEDVKSMALQSDINVIYDKDLINGLQEKSDEDYVSIGDIEMSDIVPENERELNKDSRCAISFPYLLLQVLYRKLGQKVDMSINDFFKPSNLLSIFEKYLPFHGDNVNKEEILDFMERLVKARLALDICFIRPTDYGYLLDMNLDEDNQDLKKLKMLQSMIFVSSSNYTNYRWFNWLMDEVDKYGIPDVKQLYTAFKSAIDTTFELPSYDDLAYHGDNRYWFWRLDFYIWLNRKEIFADDSQALSVAENYVFKRNRSIEHIAPQTPKSDSMMKWADGGEDDVVRDCFGNLVMISQGLNSALSNESYEVKKAHVQSYYNDSKSGSIESLKLLMIYKDHPYGWNKDAIKEHGEKMYKYLQDSYQQL